MFRPDFRVFFFNLGNRLFHQPSPFSRIEVMSIPKATSLVAGGKKKKHVTVLPGFCPPLFASNQKSAGIIVWCPSWCQQFPRFRHLSRRLYRWAGGFFLGGGPLEICWRISCQPSLVGSHPKKRKPPKNPHAKHPLLLLSPSFQVRFLCQNDFHLSFHAVMQFTCIEQPPTQGFQQNLLKLQISSGNSWAFGMSTNKNPEPTLKNNLKKKN